jgi:integrase
VRLKSIGNEGFKISVRKRTWKNPTGETKESWIVDYVDQAGTRRLKTFKRKKEADTCHSQVRVDVRAGVHSPDSASTTVTKAAGFWIETCESRKLERSTVASYRQHLKFHILPFLGRLKLSQLATPLIREFEDKLRRGDPAPGEAEGKSRSPAMIKKITSSLGALLTDAQHDKARIATKLANRIKDLGYDVCLTPVA